MSGTVFDIQVLTGTAARTFRVRAVSSTLPEANHAPDDFCVHEWLYTKVNGGRPASYVKAN